MSQSNNSINLSNDNIDFGDNPLVSQCSATPDLTRSQAFVYEENRRMLEDNLEYQRYLNLTASQPQISGHSLMASQQENKKRPRSPYSDDGTAPLYSLDFNPTVFFDPENTHIENLNELSFLDYLDQFSDGEEESLVLEPLLNDLDQFSGDEDNFFMEQVGNGPQLTPVFDWGTKNTPWSTFVDGLASGAKYKVGVQKFLTFHEQSFTLHYSSQGNPYNMIYENARKYISFLHDTERKKATTLRSIYSILKQFFVLSGRYELLEKKQPLIEKLLKQWEKEEVKKKSKTFTAGNLVRLYEAPNTTDTVLLKAYAAVAPSFAGRGKEIYGVKYNGVSRLLDDLGRAAYRVIFDPCKVDNRSTDEFSSLITGRLEVQAIDNYRALFPGAIDPNNGHFFRRISNMSVSWAAANVGKNSLAQMPSKIAAYLGLDDAGKYTGHAFRRTAASIAAHNGASLVELKALTRHKSDTVLQGYIANTDAMKLNHAGKLSVGGTTDYI